MKKKNDRKDKIMNIVEYIKEQVKNDGSDNPGLVFLPTYRTEKQLTDDGGVMGGILTNVENAELLELALLNAMRGYVDQPKYERIDTALFPKGDKEQENQVALRMASILFAALSDVDDWVKHISVLLSRLQDEFGSDRDITFSALPKNLHGGFDSGTLNCGMVVTAKPEDQVRNFATMILGYCVKNDLDIERFIDGVFSEVMTAKITITDNDGNKKSNS